MDYNWYGARLVKKMSRCFMNKIKKSATFITMNFSLDQWKFRRLKQLL